MPAWNARLYPRQLRQIESLDELPASLCFKDAWAARYLQRIDHEEYYRHIFAHLNGASHDEDQSSPYGGDAFSKAVLDCGQKIGPLEDTSEFVQIFIAYEAHDLEAIKRGVQNMRAEHVPYVLRILASRALKDKNPPVLEYCLTHEVGFEYTHDFVFEANWLMDGASNDGETIAVLDRSDFREVHPKPERHPVTEFDVGGRFPVEW